MGSVSFVLRVPLLGVGSASLWPSPLHVETEGVVGYQQFPVWLYPLLLEAEGVVRYRQFPVTVVAETTHSVRNSISLQVRSPGPVREDHTRPCKWRIESPTHPPP